MDERTSGSDPSRVPPAHDALPARPRDITDIPSWDVDPATPLYRIRPIALLFTTRVMSNVTNHMITVAVGYQLYDLIESASLLGLIGLAQFLPPLVLMLFAGQASDRFNRKSVLRVCYAVELGATLGFLSISLMPAPSIPAIFCFVLTNATARTFELPAIAAGRPLIGAGGSTVRAVSSAPSFESPAPGEGAGAGRASSFPQPRQNL